jgi:hypothetical protein
MEQVAKPSGVLAYQVTFPDQDLVVVPAQCLVDGADAPANDRASWLVPWSDPPVSRSNAAGPDSELEQSLEPRGNRKERGARISPNQRRPRAGLCRMLRPTGTIVPTGSHLYTLIF